MVLQESGEMYLESILVLIRQGKAVRSIDIVDYMGYSKPSVSRAVGLLKAGQYIDVDNGGYITLTAAGREVMARQTRRFTGGWGFGLGTLSMFVSSFTVSVLALVVVIGNTPWYAPQYAIPLLGMVLGNTMNGIALGLDRLTQEASAKRAVLEARLALGQDWDETIADTRREAIRVGMIPIINAMAAAGIVSLPGMMTGQILAGTPPVETVKYQILVMFLIAGGTGFGTVVAVSLGARRLFDNRQRLRLDRLRTSAD